MMWILATADMDKSGMELVKENNGDLLYYALGKRKDISSRDSIQPDPNGKRHPSNAETTFSSDREATFFPGKDTTFPSGGHCRKQICVNEEVTKKVKRSPLGRPPTNEEKEVKPWNSFHPDMGALQRRKHERAYYPDEPVSDSKEERFRDVLDIVEEYGHIHKTCNVPRGMVCFLKDNVQISLGHWVHNMRKEKKLGKMTIYRQQHFQRLVDSGLFNWSMQKFKIGLLLTTDDDMWEDKFRLMLKYGDEHDGNCNVPRPYVCTSSYGYEVNLGVWLLKQKSRKESGILRPDRMARLQALVDAGKFRWGKPRRKYGQFRRAETDAYSSDNSEQIML